MPEPSEDFILEITTSSNPGGHSYRGRVAASPRGPSPEFAIDLPWSPEELEKLAARWEAAVCRDFDADRPAETGAAEERAALLDESSRQLTACLFSGPAGGLLRASLARLALKRRQGKLESLRIVLREERAGTADGGLAALPWELLREPEGPAFLSRGVATSLVRTLGPGPAGPPPTAELPLRVLLVTASPHGMAGLDLAREQRRVEAAAMAVNHLGIVELDAFAGGSVGSLRHTLENGRFHIVHFMGHGGAHPETGERGLWLEEPDGSPRFLPGGELGDLLAAGEPPRLVVLNACRTGFGLADDLLGRGIPAVVAMQWKISDDMAVDFATSFYEDLTAGFSIETSVGLWREAAASYSGEWATPVIFLNAGDGRLIDPAALESRRPDPAGGPRPLHLAIRSLIESSPAHPPAWGKPSELGADRLLSLSSSFDGRKIRRPELWKKRILPKLQRFLGQAAGEGRPLLIDLAAHQSLAFAAGYYLEVKAGVDVTVRQRGGRPTEDWDLLHGEVPAAPLWRELEDFWLGGGPDLAVAIEIARPVEADVRRWLDGQPAAERPPIGRLLRASIHPAPGQTQILSGRHAFALAEQLEAWIWARSAGNRNRTVHLFASAPNGFLLALGRLARNLGKIQLYEYDFGGTGTYVPSFTLPPEEYEPVRPKS